MARRFSGLWLWVGCAACVACGGTNVKKLQLGALLSVNGELANIGSEQLEAANLAVEQINAAGGVLGSQLELLNRDDNTSDTAVVSAAQAHVAAGVPVVFGATGSAISMAALQVFKGTGIVQISASSTSPLLSTEPDDGFFFRTCPSDASQGKLLAKRADAASYGSVAVIHLPGAYGTGLADAFKTAFEASGGTVPIVKEYVPAQTSYATLISEVLGKTPKAQAIVLIAYPVDGAQLLKDYKVAFPSETVAWYFTDALEDSAFMNAAGAALFNQIPHEGTGPYTPTGARYDAFASAFSARYSRNPSPGSFSPNIYDAVYLVALAMEAAGDSSGASVKANLNAVSSGGTVFSAAQYKEAVTAVKAGTDIDYQGASGNVDFDAVGDAPAPYDIWNVESGAVHIKERAVNP